MEGPAENCRAQVEGCRCHLWDMPYAAPSHKPSGNVAADSPVRHALLLNGRASEKLNLSEIARNSLSEGKRQAAFSKSLNHKTAEQQPPCISACWKRATQKVLQEHEALDLPT